MDRASPSAERLLDIIPCGVISFEANGQVLYCNQKFQDFIGYTAAEIIGQKIEKFLTLPGRVFFQTHLLPLLRLQNTVEEVFVNFKAKSGQSLPMFLNGQVIEEDQQLVVHCACFPVNHRSRYEEQLLQDKRNVELHAQTNDQETRKQLEQEKEENDRYLRELKDLNKELLQFQKVISHDISEQMRKIQLFTDRLIEKSAPIHLEKQKEYRTVIKDSFFKIKRLLDRFSQFIALTEKNETPVAVDLNVIMQQAFKKISSIYPDTITHLEIDQIPSIKGLPIQLERMFFHLLDNSFKYHREDISPHITISTCILPYNSLEGITNKYRYQNYLQILYTDNSQGFPKQYNEEVFVLMNRITPESKGGFGLPFCKKIVNNHHGFISINPAFKGGMQVKIYLPV